MTDIRTVIVLAVAALLLVGGLVALALINPFAALGLSPVLVAVAAIIRAIRGGPRT